jgi:hypothetical protein
MPGTSSLTSEVPRVAHELAVHLQASSAAYAAMPFEEVAEAGELLLLGIIRSARTRDTAMLETHLARVGALRADQLVAATDIALGFTEIRRALSAAVAALPPAEAESEPGLELLLRVADDAQRRLTELLRSPR